jgi:hypothetical protein
MGDLQGKPESLQILLGAMSLKLALGNSRSEMQHLSTFVTHAKGEGVMVMKKSLSQDSK